MNEYYRLLPDYKSLCVEIEMRGDPEGDINDDLYMKAGEPLTISPETQIIFDFEIDPYELLPGETWSLPAYNTEGPTMDVKLIQTLQRAGVDNLQIYPAVFVNSESGEEFHDLHAAINVIGLVSCADMGASHAQPLADTHFFHELKIDEKKAMGLLMFRLAEQPSDIIVHGNVAQAIKAGGFSGLILEEVS